MYYHVNARRWFDKKNGNTYHSVAVMSLDGTNGAVKIAPFQYGYGSAYEQTALKLILGEYPRYTNGNPVPAWKWYEENNHKVMYDVVDVARRKDLHQG